MLIHFKNLKDKYGLKSTGVLHVGGHYAEEIADYYGNGINKSIWVEADPESFAILEQKIKDYPNALAFNSCISEKDGEQVEFNISNNEGQSSSLMELDYHKIAHVEVEFVKKISLVTKRLDTLLQENNLSIKDYTFLNFDIQGAELLALKSLGDLLWGVEALYLEVNEKHLYKDCPLIPDIDAYLQQYDFCRVETEMCGNFGWGDALYVKVPLASQSGNNSESVQNKETSSFELASPTVIVEVDGPVTSTAMTIDASEFKHGMLPPTIDDGLSFAGESLEPIVEETPEERAVRLEKFKEQTASNLYDILEDAIKKGMDRYNLKNLSKGILTTIMESYDENFRK